VQLSTTTCRLVSMAWQKQRMQVSLVIAVRAAIGRPPEIAKHFGLPADTVWRIKRGIAGSHVPYTPTVLLPKQASRGRGGKLSEEQRACIEHDFHRSRAASEEYAAKFGITGSRVREIWRETDFMAAHFAAVSKAEARSS
jgi:transposase